MSYEVSREDVDRVEMALQGDIRWAMCQPGLRWSPSYGAWWDGKRWLSEEDEGTENGSPPDTCGVCAIAAHVLRYQPEPGTLESCVGVAARSLGVPREFVKDIYRSVLDSEYEDRERVSDPTAGQALGFRIREFADALVAKGKAQP